jgi:hypothetical protein
MTMLNISRRGIFALMACLSLIPLAEAHGPTRQKVTEEIEISAPPAAVWAVVGDFTSIANWHPALATSPASKGSEVGSVRTLTLKSGGTLVEELEARDSDAMTLKYRAMDGGALPVTNYSSTMVVTAQGAGSKVVWRGAFYRGFPNNDPPPEQNDEAAVKAVTGVYKSGLQSLKAFVEKK